MHIQGYMSVSIYLSIYLYIYIYIYIYIFIYIYIIPVLVVTKSLGGFVVNQVQYYVESAQSLALINFIIIKNEYIIDLYT